MVNVFVCIYYFRDFLVLAVKSNGLTIVNGFTRDVIGEFNTNG